RRLYLRQFSFDAAIACFELAAYRAAQHSREVFAVSEHFKHQFEKLFKLENFVEKEKAENFSLTNAELPVVRSDFGLFEVDQFIYVLDVERDTSHVSIPNADVTVLVYAESASAGFDAARLFVKRARHPVIACIVVGDVSEEAKKLRKAMERVSSEFLVLTNQYAFPCRDWLEFAYKAYARRDVKVVHAATGDESK
ncbi:hypothetical protein, partial [Staphylococcus aureus]|uniref:hypothetical protein n=1 Tax=Staphylococcus aureus TaxID=1280 RepID=UPI00301DB0BD